ncbi:MAG: DUF2914 domain-containing protein [Desulfobacteraceae bacterium]|nr:DUF2914 domain-containing protein [Desulfobacteraceae bacterium]
MNREMIEDKDLFLLKKIREILENKENLKHEEDIPEKKSVWQRAGFWLLILCAGGVMTGVMFFRNPSPIIASNNPGPGTEAAVEEIKSTVAAKIADPVEVVDTREMVPVQEIRREEAPASMETDPPERDAVSQQEAARGCEGVSGPEVPGETTAAVMSGPAEETGISSGVRIAEIVSCSEITQREYEAPRKVFSLEKDATAAVWMNVVSDGQPFTLTHVYYLNGSRYCAIPLEIRYKSMRTWSNVTLGCREHIGEWRVEVVTGKGEILDRIEFTVVS